MPNDRPGAMVRVAGSTKRAGSVRGMVTTWSARVAGRASTSTHAGAAQSYSTMRWTRFGVDAPASRVNAMVTGLNVGAAAANLTVTDGCWAKGDENPGCGLATDM